MSGNFDNNITYLSVINITGDDSNSSGTVLGEITTDKDVTKFNEILDKNAKISSFKNAITGISKSAEGTPEEPATTTIIIEGLVSDNQYEFTKINSGLDNFNTYSLADKKTKVQELINTVLLSDSSSDGEGEGEKECTQVKPPNFSDKIVKSESGNSEIEKQANALLQIVECLKETNTENNTNISKIITELGAEAGSRSFTKSSIERIMNYADDESSQAILLTCVTKYYGEAEKAIKEGETKGVNVKKQGEEGEGEGEEGVEPSEILGDAIGKTFVVCGQTAAAATVIAALVPFLYYISILPETLSNRIGDILAGSMGTLGGRPKKKTRKKKSRKTKRKSRKTKRKNRKSRKGRSRKIKRKHR
jgi:hypothetical protein